MAEAKKVGRLADPDWEPSDAEMDEVLAGALRSVMRQRLRAMGALHGGYEVLMSSGFTTQVTRLEYIVVPDSVEGSELANVVAPLTGVEVHRRPAAWLQQLWTAGAVEPAHGAQLDQLPRLRPGAALADLLRFTGKPDPDDIDFDLADRAEVDLYRRLCSTGYA